MYDHLVTICLDNFNRDGEVFLKLAANTELFKKALLWKYNQLTPIPERELPELLLFAKELRCDADEWEQHRIAKMVYTLGTLLNQ